MITFRRYPGYPDSDRTKTILPWYYFRIGVLHVEFHRSTINYHDGFKKTRCKGWQVINLKRANNRRGPVHSFRIIKYWKSGEWWHLDIHWNRTP